MIETSLNLFHKKGITATSVDEILHQSGTGKSQFYHYFRNKEGLVHQVLQYFYDALRSGLTPALMQIETWKDLELWFQAFLDYQKSVRCERGCPIGTIGNDLADKQDLLRQDVKLIFAFTRHSLARFFSGRKAKGELPRSTDPEALADFCFVIQQGGLLVSKIERNSEPFESSIDQLMEFLRRLRTS